MARVPSELFNPIYWHLLDAIKDPNIRFVYLMGGSSAAKTYSVVQNLSLELTGSGDSSIIFRKESTTIDDSIYKDFKNFIKEQPILARQNDVIQRKIRNTVNGGEIVFRGLDEDDKTKGITGFKYALMEEMDKFIHEDFKQLRKRLRGMPGQKIIGTWNPVSEKSWIKTEVLDAEEWIEEETEGAVWKPDDHPTTKIRAKFRNKRGNAVLLKTNYLDNFWIVGHPTNEDIGFVDKHTVEDFEFDKENDYEYYRVYGLGDWGQVRTGQEFVHSFKRSKHVTKIERDPSNWIWITHDFNNLPYMTALMVEVRDKTIRVTGEVCLPPPYNSTDDVVDELNRRILPTDTYINLTGDPSGNSSSHRKGRNDARNLFDGIESRWREHGIGVQNHVPRSAVRINDAQKNPLRYMALNRLCSGWRGYTLIVDESCKNTIHDFEVLQNDGNGGFVKPKVKNKQTGQTYEDAGHCMDALIYCLQQNCSELFNPKIT